jgi:shikimate dehydrogenase
MLENLSGLTRLYPLVGDPVGQVKSPAGVTRAFEERGQDAICIAIQVAPSDFAPFMATMQVTKNVDGIIVTVPHKFAAYEACATVSEAAAFLKTVNTIRRNTDGSFHGDMFDGHGFVAACRENGAIFKNRRALLVGAGGAGTAIAQAVAAAGVAHLTIADLDAARCDDLVTRLKKTGYNVSAGKADATGHDLIFNATPLGMRETDPLPVPKSGLKPFMFVGDVVTKPEVSPLIAAACSIGCSTSTGLDMFAKVRDLLVEFLLEPLEAKTPAKAEISARPENPARPR